MKIRKSRLVDRLDADIASERDKIRADCLRAERAAYFVRQGDLEDAKSAIVMIRSRYSAHPVAAISAWLHLVEALLSHFGEMDFSANDKMRRAHAISAAAGLKALHCLSAAWLAHMDYTRLDIESACLHVLEALSLAEIGHHAAQSRINLVIGQALHLANRYDLAKLRYRQVHEHATAEGDDATISALMHNMAWLHMSSLRQSVLCNLSESDPVKYALLSAESTEHFDKLVGSTSWDGLKSVLRAQILSLQGKTSEALILYDEYIEVAAPTGAKRFGGNLLADQAWCRLAAGQLDLALRDADSAQASLSEVTQIDDRAAAHSRLAQVYEALGDNDSAINQQVLANEAWANYAELQSRIVRLFGDL